MRMTMVDLLALTLPLMLILILTRAVQLRHLVEVGWQQTEDEDEDEDAAAALMKCWQEAR